MDQRGSEGEEVVMVVESVETTVAVESGEREPWRWVEDEDATRLTGSRAVKYPGGGSKVGA